jgi:LmbE family N-acetylglucosaminyl deacetylase
MPTDARWALFLFAHQDDEFGVFHRIEECRAQGLRVACAYLTSGATVHASAAVRNAESLAVLGKLGVDATDVAFAGELLGIGDARLPLHLDAAFAWIAGWVAGYGQVESLHAPAWEGGHHDHDALHALALAVAQEHDLLRHTRQFSLYQAAGLPGPLFRVLAPLPANGPAIARRIPWGARWRYLRYCLSYPSQRGSWLGLFPCVLLHYLVRGTESLQPVFIERIRERPHPAPLYYEKRQFFTWDEMARRLQAWRVPTQSQSQGINDDHGQVH